jgi:hypothetical protein
MALAHQNLAVAVGAAKEPAMALLVLRLLTADSSRRL